MRNADALGGQVVATGLWFPEGPVMLPDGRVAVVEVGAGTVVAVGPDGRRDILSKPGGGPNGLAWGPDGALYLCNNGGASWIDDGEFREPHGIAPDYETGRIERIDPATGEFQRLYDNCDGVRINAPNDIVFSPDESPSEGGFWFTDYGKNRGRVRDLGVVYWAAADGTRILESSFPIWGGPNGVGLSPDGKTLYVAETETGRVLRWEIRGPGELVKDPWPDGHGGDLVAQVPGTRRLDSLAVTAAGNIVVGTLFAKRESTIYGELTTISPDGDILDIVCFDDPLPTNVCFGGPELKTAYVTLSRTGVVMALPWNESGLRLPFSPG